MMAFDFAPLEAFLVCSASRSKLVQEEDSLVCVDPECRLQYAVRDDIPIMLVDEAVRLPQANWAAVMQRHSRDGQTGQPIGGES